MAAGDMTASVVGTYATMVLAVAAIDAGNLPATTDRYDIYMTPGASGSACFTVVKQVRATA